MNWLKAKLQTFGVEIEMNNIRRQDAARIAAEFFGTNDYQYTGGGYMTWSAVDDRGREWKFARDVSISGPDDCKCEMVTPILRYDDDMEMLQELVRVLRRAGAVSHWGQGCGVHIHIGVDKDKPNGHDGRSLRNLMNLMASKEELLIKSVGISEFRLNRYCQRVNRRLLEALKSEKPKTVEDMQALWYRVNGGNPNQHYDSSRYRMLNYHSIGRTKTIEFRLFQFDVPDGDKKNGLHAGALKSYIQLCLAMSQEAKDSKTISAAPVQLENEKFAMRTWMNRMGMIGEEFATAREIFGRKLTGDAAFRYGRPQ